ncbi:LysR family transcriptional regulator [Vibrio zhanjiangensis]|uniref:LysR family transcriptional regulator n=1 Tax=Vibrio zhanjiangensis TaxID=1046128 RepID=A0ABQ6F2S0_9VIBR|nr:hydrogen peroxide-inducible genes activator [Vibrio zhanjiangensis]GLT19509.1 LysR family transcriptional regulator [Vibrio zhanjiangensis]
MIKWPNLKQLHYLITLHETRHFSEAAKKCFVSQSTLSKGIQNIEDLIGCPLYEKKDKKSPLVFTLTGEQVVKQGRELLAKGQDLVELGRLCQADDMQGKLRLGCIPTIAPFLLCDLVQEVNQRFPMLNLLLREDTTQNLLAALRHGELDVLILALPVDIDGMESKIVGKDPFKMIISRHQANTIRTPIKYDELPDEFVFLLEKEHCLTEHAVSACQLTSKEKINPFSATSLHTLVQMVANGMGVTFIPQMAIDHGLIDNQNLVVIDPPEQQAHRHIGLVWRPSSSRVNTFNHLAQVVSELL